VQVNKISYLQPKQVPQMCLKDFRLRPNPTEQAPLPTYRNESSRIQRGETVRLIASIDYGDLPNRA